jgi:FtsH-binding integral membrane protein
VSIRLRFGLVVVPAHPFPDAGPEDDPGYLASLRTGTLLAQLRRAFLGLLTVPVGVLALSPYIMRIETHTVDAPPLWACAAVPLAAVGVLLAVRRMPGALPPGAGASESFRAALFLRFALTEGVVLFGLPLSMASDSFLPMALSFCLGYPLVLSMGIPTRRTIERIRTRMEAGGTATGLWAALLSPYEKAGTRG